MMHLSEYGTYRSHSSPAYLQKYTAYYISQYENRKPTAKVVFLLVSCGGVRLSKLGTSATNWPIVPAPDDR
jgi:hypothetical protein